MNGLAGKGIFPPHESDGFYYLDLCTGLTYVASGSVESGWLQTPEISECTHFYFNDTVNKVIWKVSRKKDKVVNDVVTAVYKVHNIAKDYCNDDIFVDTNTKTWYKLVDCRWLNKMVCDDTAWFNSVGPMVIPDPTNVMSYNNLSTTLYDNLNWTNNNTSASPTVDGSYAITITVRIESVSGEPSSYDLIAARNSLQIGPTTILNYHQGMSLYDLSYNVGAQYDTVTMAFNASLLATDLLSVHLSRAEPVSVDLLTCLGFSMHRIGPYIVSEIEKLATDVKKVESNELKKTQVTALPVQKSEPIIRLAIAEPIVQETAITSPVVVSVAPVAIDEPIVEEPVVVQPFILRVVEEEPATEEVVVEPVVVQASPEPTS